jgi:hypothetical protein
MRRWLIAGVATMAVAAVLAPLALAGATGTISFSVSSSPTIGVAESITASGAIEAAGKLTVYIVPGSKCPSEADAYEQEPKDASVLGSAPVSAGSFSQTYSVTPASAGDFMLCGYLDEVRVHERTRDEKSCQRI